MKTPWTSTSENAKHCKANWSCLLPPAPGAPPDTEPPASISRHQRLDLFLFKFLQSIECIGGSALMQPVSSRGLLTSHCWLTLNLAGVLTCYHVVADAAQKESHMIAG